MTDLPKKSLGQHWLNDHDSLVAIADAADIHPGENILEIGPGQGALSHVLVEREADVHALEFDGNLVPDLVSKFPDVKVEQGDIRTFDLSQLPDQYKIVANIPYYLTANLMRILSEPPTHKPVKAVLLIQKEVAQRVAAQPGDMAFMSVAVQFYYEVSLGVEVPAELFTPPPKVDSQVLILTKRRTPLFGVDAKDFLRFVKICFAQRRKTLLNNLVNGLHISREAAQAISLRANIEPQRRPQTLSLEEWHSLFTASRASQ
jgi:16S rRNA (adenine1518-N6/adenine1519-N6)-dimethyltransferase